MDYMFMDGKSPVLVILDEKTKRLIAQVVPNKGLYDHYIAKRVAEILDSTGYDRVILKSDGEPAIRDIQEEARKERQQRIEDLEELKKEVKQYRAAETMLEKSEEGESQSNGRIERHIQKLKAQVRTLKSGMEAKLGEKMPDRHPLLAWLVQWAAETITRYEVGPDGETPYQRWRGRTSKKRIAMFGEKVLWKPLDVAANKRRPDEARWEIGHWLGLTMRRDQAIIGTPTGVVRTRADNIKGTVPEERWRAEDLWQVIGWPWKPSLVKGGDDIPTAMKAAGREGEEADGRRVAKPSEEAFGDEADVRLDTEEPKEEDAMKTPDATSRALYIRGKDVEKYGATIGCKACERVRGGKIHKAVGHTQKCRERMKKLMMEDERDQHRVAEADDRKWQEVERIVEELL